jgi:hypothetical protein
MLFNDLLREENIDSAGVLALRHMRPCDVHIISSCDAVEKIVAQSLITRLTKWAATSPSEKTLACRNHSAHDPLLLRATIS